jgi:hypothetical protein
VFFDIYVVFTNDDGNWWSRLLHHRIKHCYVIVPSMNCSIVHSKTTGIFDLYNESDINGIIDSNSIVMGYKQKSSSRSLFMLNTCVGHTKQLLGIGNPFIWTPYQLYKYLRKHHGKQTKSA